MTREDAIATGHNAAVRFGKPFVVYRFPAWPMDRYGVIAVDRLLPMEAETFERLEPSGPAPAPADQGSLF